MDFSKYVPMEESYEDQRFGLVAIFYNPEDEKDIICIKTRQFSTREEFEQKMQIAEERLRFSSPYILKMLYVEPNEEHLAVNICFEYPNEDLVVRAPFLKDHNEVLKLMHDILCGMAYLEKHKLVHGNVRPEFIFYNAKEAKYVLLDRLGEDFTPNQIQHENIFNGFYLYLDPALFGNLCRNNLYHNHNLFKSEVFALGMVIISMMIYDDPNLEPLSIQELYDRDTGNFNEPRFLMILESVKYAYFNTPESQIIFDFICTCLLNVDPQQRLGPYRAFKTLRETLWKVGQARNKAERNHGNDQQEQLQNDFTASIDTGSLQDQSLVSKSELQSDIMQDPENFHQAGILKIKQEFNVMHSPFDRSPHNEINQYGSPEISMQIFAKETPRSNSVPNKDGEPVGKFFHSEVQSNQQDLDPLKEKREEVGQSRFDSPEVHVDKTFRQCFSFDKEQSLAPVVAQNNCFFASASSHVDNETVKNDYTSPDVTERNKNPFFDDLASGSHSNFNEPNQSNPVNEPPQISNVPFTFVNNEKPDVPKVNEPDPQNSLFFADPSLNPADLEGLDQAEVRSDQNIAKFSSHKNSKYYSNDNKNYEKRGPDDIQSFDSKLVENKIEAQYSEKGDAHFQVNESKGFSSSANANPFDSQPLLTSQKSANSLSDKVNAFFDAPAQESSKQLQADSFLQKLEESQGRPKEGRSFSDHSPSFTEAFNNGSFMQQEEPKNEILPVLISLPPEEAMSHPQEPVHIPEEDPHLSEAIPSIVINYARKESAVREENPPEEVRKEDSKIVIIEHEILPATEPLTKSDIVLTSNQYTGPDAKDNSPQNRNKNKSQPAELPRNQVYFRAEDLQEILRIEQRNSEERRLMVTVTGSSETENITRNSEIIPASWKNMATFKSSEEYKDGLEYQTNFDQISKTQIQRVADYYVQDSVRFEVSDKTISKIEKVESKSILFTEVQPLGHDPKRQSAQSTLELLSSPLASELKKHHSLPNNVMIDSKMVEKMKLMGQIPEEIDSENLIDPEMSPGKRSLDPSANFRSQIQAQIDHMKKTSDSKNDLNEENPSAKYILVSSQAQSQSKNSIKLPELHEFNELRSTVQVESLQTSLYNKPAPPHPNPVRVETVSQMNQETLQETKPILLANELKVIGEIAKTPKISEGVHDSKRPSLYRSSVQAMNESKKITIELEQEKTKLGMSKQNPPISNAPHTETLSNAHPLPMPAVIQQNPESRSTIKEDYQRNTKTVQASSVFVNEIHRNVYEAKTLKASYFVNSQAVEQPISRKISRTPDIVRRGTLNESNQQQNVNRPQLGTEIFLEHICHDGSGNIRTLPRFNEYPGRNTGRVIVNKADLGSEALPQGFSDVRRSNTPSIKPRFDQIQRPTGREASPLPLTSNFFRSEKTSQIPISHERIPHFQSNPALDDQFHPQRVYHNPVHPPIPHNNQSIENRFQAPNHFQGNFFMEESQPFTPPITQFHSEVIHYNSPGMHGVHHITYLSNNESHPKSESQVLQHSAPMKLSSEQIFEATPPRQVIQPRALNPLTQGRPVMNRSVSPIVVQRHQVQNINEFTPMNHVKPQPIHSERGQFGQNARLLNLPIRQVSPNTGFPSKIEEFNRKVFRKPSDVRAPEPVIHSMQIPNFAESKPQVQQMKWHSAKETQLSAPLKTFVGRNDNAQPDTFKKSRQEPSVFQISPLQHSGLPLPAFDQARGNVVSSRSRTPMKLSDNFAPQHVIKKADGTVNILHKVNPLSRAS